MWKRFAEVLRCPLCRGSLELHGFVEDAVDLGAGWIERARALEISEGILGMEVEEGELLCHPCRTRFPITRGLPIMLPYATALHDEFARRWADRVPGNRLKYPFPARQPALGEHAVRATFSTEWLEYDYDGVIWELNYTDHERRFEMEVGTSIASCRMFLEVGCGLGLATAEAQKRSAGDCVGMDLSLAVMKAQRHFQGNPFMHFVQASAFNPPFREEQFDVIYSRGVLHHTYSTKDAFDRIAPLCRQGGMFYLWLYGHKSITSTPLRWILFALESVSRPVISRRPESLLSQLFLKGVALAYMAFNGGRRLFNRQIQALTFRRAIHAARDRFTPRYAHRHSEREIKSWFATHRFDQPTVIDWRSMPLADQDDFRRNVGMRAIKTG